MSLILNIDTSTETAGIFLSSDGVLLSSALNPRQNDQAAWIHTAIDKLMKDAGYWMKDLKAVAVVAGPGSYTGLRVGMASAKGICYALDIPLITENTLELMAASAIIKLKELPIPPTSIFCPLIDARRMEVFTAVYDSKLVELLSPRALVLDDSSFDSWLTQGPVLFFGSGAAKWQQVCRHSRAFFEPVDFSGEQFVLRTYSKFLRNEFTVLAYAEPVYLKEFYTHPK